jgi:mannose-6-phosphate isomerase
MHILEPAQKHYAWGSRSAIQTLTGIGAPGEPLAEIWYGAHRLGPSILEDGGSLSDLIEYRSVDILGAEVAGRFAGQLPFLVKLLAPGQAVSLQVHPRAARAREGYAGQRRSASGVAMFVDANHKPEQILALTEFEGLVGLRPAEHAATVLGAFGGSLTSAARATLTNGEDGLRSAVRLMAEASVEDIRGLVQRARELVRERPGAETAAAARTVIELAAQYPDDAGVAVSLLLERVRLDPGDSVMVLSGVPHAYLSGLALEVMANSDNVFRLGLTAKALNVNESVNNLLTTPAVVNRPHAGSTEGQPEEFRLDVHTLEGSVVKDTKAGPRIVLTVAGDCEIHSGERRVALRPGGAVFLPHGAEATIYGNAGQAAVISVPERG